MLNDEPTPDQCQRCYSFDKAGTESLRKTANRKFGHHLPEILAKTDADGTYSEFKLRHIDFRYSNQCNLRCRSCCHDLSSAWHAESVKLYGKGRTPILIRPKNQGYLDELVEVLPYVESLYFAGGEPLMQPEHYFILSKLKEIGNTNVELSYATNFTMMFSTKYDVLKHWEGFKSVELMASIDGTHARGDLLRKNQEWETIVANRRRLMELKPAVGSFRFLVTATLSAMNVYHLPDIHKEWIDLGLAGSGRPLHQPAGHARVLLRTDPAAAGEEESGEDLSPVHQRLPVRITKHGESLSVGVEFHQRKRPKPFAAAVHRVDAET